MITILIVALHTAGEPDTVINGSKSEGYSAGTEARNG
jgi:hypothetical protein